MVSVSTLSVEVINSKPLPQYFDTGHFYSDQLISNVGKVLHRTFIIGECENRIFNLFTIPTLQGYLHFNAVGT